MQLYHQNRSWNDEGGFDKNSFANLAVRRKPARFMAGKKTRWQPRQRQQDQTN